MESGKLAGDRALRAHRADKKRERAYDESVKPLRHYRQEELFQMRKSFLDPQSEYHRARTHFVYKTGDGRLPAHIAVHRRADDAGRIVTGAMEGIQLRKKASQKNRRMLRRPSGSTGRGFGPSLAKVKWAWEVAWSTRQS